MTELGANVEEIERANGPNDRTGSEHLIGRALDMLPRSAAAVLDLDKRFLAVFGEALGMAEMRRESLVGKTIVEVFIGRTVDQLTRAFEQATEGESSNFEILAVDDRTWYEIDVKPVVQDGQVTAVFGFATDITGRKTAEAGITRERQLLADVLDSIGHLVSVKDRDRRVLHINESFEKYTGIRRDQAVGELIDGFFPPEVARRLHKDDSEVFDRGKPVRVQRQLEAADGTVGTMLTERTPLRDPDGSIYGIVTVGLDISDQLAAERGLAEAEQRFEAAFMNARNGMALVGLDGSFMRVNPALSELTGYPSDELTELSVADIAHPDDMSEQVELVQRALTREFDSYSLEKRFTKKSGETVWVMLAVSLVRDENGRVPYVIAQTTNISARMQVEADLRDEADRDPLTELVNRRLIERAIELQIERAKLSGDRSILLMMDIDDLKAINDEHGHEVGDHVLKLFAKELTGQVRSDDIAGRLGGDEFVVLMTGVNPDRAPRIVEELMLHFEKTDCAFHEIGLACAVSVGWTVVDRDTESPARALASADRSMYEVKRARKARQ